MRIAIITEQPEANGSTYYRALQHVPRLRKRADVVDIFVPRVSPVRGPGLRGKSIFFAKHAKGYASRARELARELPSYDAALVQRGVYPMGPSPVAMPLVRFGGRVVYDLDDAVFYPSPALETRGPLARWMYGPHQARALLRRADAIVVSTAILADALPGRSADLIEPTVPDPVGYPHVDQRMEGLARIGWTGTVGNVHYLDAIREPITRLAAETVAELEVVAPVAWEGPAKFTRWRREDDPNYFGRFDIGIMPLPDTAYTRAKAGFKLLQYMAAGSAVVASPVGVNSWLVEESGAGFLATEPAEWEQALRHLASDYELRRQFGENGRAFIERYVDLDSYADRLIRLLAG